MRIEDAGFEIRDMIAWVYGSGFPKSLDVSKAIDKAAGAEREVGKPGPYSARRPRAEVQAKNAYQSGVGDYASSLITAPATAKARQWAGWGTALKPALEPITMARKPFPGTVAANVLEHGTGAINVDGCRVGSEGGTRLTSISKKGDGIYEGGINSGAFGEVILGLGRWPLQAKPTLATLIQTIAIVNAFSEHAVLLQTPYQQQPL